jgi:hypothetical protein
MTTRQTRAREVAHELPLGLLFGEPGIVDMGAVRLIAAHEPLLGRDLEKLQRRGVPSAARAAVISWTCRTVLSRAPTAREDHQFRIGRSG